MTGTSSRAVEPKVATVEPEDVLHWPRVWRYSRSLRRLRRANHRRRLARLHDIPDTLRSLPLGYATHGLDEFGSYIS